MKSILGFVVAAMISAVRADAGVDLSWDACAGDVSATGVKNLACSGDETYHVYVCFQPSAILRDFVGIEGEIAIQSEDGPLGDFWSFEAGGANEGSFSFTDRWSPIPNCTAASPWGPSVDHPRFEFTRSGNRARILFTEARSTAAPTIAAGTNLAAFRIDIDESGAGSLEGCDNPVTWVLIQVDLFSATQTQVTERESGLRGNCITMNGAGPSTCAATPVRSRTWGAVKSLYR